MSSSESNQTVQLYNYSEKSVVISGNTKPYKEVISAAGGLYNASLRFGESRKPGWVFQKSKQAAAEKIVNDINSGKIPSVPEQNVAKNASAGNSEKIPIEKTSNQNQELSVLVARIEKLEAEIRVLKQELKMSRLPVYETEKIDKSKDVVFHEEEDQNDDEPPKTTSLMFPKKK